MKCKRDLFFICIIICLFSISSVCASEISNETTDSIGYENDDQVIESVDDMAEISANNNDGTFTDLANAIANANGELQLHRNYVYDSTKDSKYQYKGIEINKEITINGNGFTINGVDKAHAFTVENDNVILRNIVFTNCYGENQDPYGGTLGGAVYWKGANGSLINCSLEQCISRFTANEGGVSFGGAVYWHGADGSISDCNFTECYSYTWDNDCESCGGAVYWEGANGSISNCYLKNCFSRGYQSSGGAVYWYGANGNLSNCYLENCYSNTYSDYECSSGGAVYWYGANGIISDCDFIECNSSTDQDGSALGGAVYWHGANGIISNCNLENCFSKGFDAIGGAVYWEGANGSLIDCNLKNCYSHSYANFGRGLGGAVDWFGADGSLINCILENCYTVCFDYGDSSGGALYWYGARGNVSGCSFVNDSADKGGAVYWEGTNGSLIDSIFEGNSAQDGQDWYNVTSITVIMSTVIDSPNVTTTYGDSGNLVVTLKDFSSKGLVGEQINIIFNNNSYNGTTDSEGQVSIPIPNNLSPKAYIATISYPGNGFYTPSSTTSNIVVNKADVNLSVQDVSVVYGDESGELVAYLTNAVTGKGLVGANVLVSINGEEYTLKTNGKGQVKVSIADLPIGVYTASVSYKGNARYSPVSTTATVTVNKMDTIISVVYNAASNEIVATITNPATGKGLITANVVVTLDGVDYALKTNGKGQVKVSTADLKSGHYNVTVAYKGNSKFNPCNVTVDVFVKSIAILSVPDVCVVYGDESGELVATLTNNEGKALVTANVVVTLDGVDYTLRTNSKGQVKLSTANLTPGVYTASVSYKGNGKYTPASATATVTVNKIGTEISAAYDGQSKELAATLTNAVTGKCIASANVIVSVDGVDYALKTNGKGQVKFSTADLAPGIYNASVSYKGNSKYSSSSANVTITI